MIPGPPGIKGITSVAFGGLNMEYLYITCFDKVYRMKTRKRGIVYQNRPQAYPSKKN